MSNTLGEVIDSLIFGLQNEDVSMARCPDGTGDFTPNILPTKGFPNSCATEVENGFPTPKFKAWFSSSDVVEIRSAEAFSSLRISDITGRELLGWEGNETKSLRLPVRKNAGSLYILQIPGHSVLRLIR